MQGESRLRKLRWACRRGMKELDLLLEAFIDRNEAGLRQGEWPQLEIFLQEDDDRIWAWIQLKQRPAEPGYLSLVEAIRDRQ